MAIRQGALESLVVTDMRDMHLLARDFAGRTAFVTGHTGFKGAWLSLFLTKLGARVTGYSLPPATTPSLFELAEVEDSLAGHHLADVRDLRKLTKAMQDAAPDIVFHLAAQPLVRLSYDNPVDTWSTNLMGTVHLLEAVRTCPSVKAVVIITTDKCYQNKEWLWGYREDDALGGNDPYSASKAGAELVVHSYRSSFFSHNGPLIASARAGNVIGGGDWSQDRLIPDAVRAMNENKPLLIRNPHATRPWQHVLESLHGYLRLGARLLAGDARCAAAFNFGPAAPDNLSVSEILTRLQTHWPALNWKVAQKADNVAKEAYLLYLDSSKARHELGWQPKWPLAVGLEKTAEWYRIVRQHPHQIRALTDQQLEQFCAS